MVESRQAEETTEDSGGGRYRPVQHGLNLIRIRSNAPGRDYMAQVIELGLRENALGFPEKELARHQGREHEIQVRHMSVQVGAIYKNIVKENGNTFTQEWLEGIIHGRLKS